MVQLTPTGKRKWWLNWKWICSCHIPPDKTAGVHIQETTDALMQNWTTYWGLVASQIAIPVVLMSDLIVENPQRIVPILLFSHCFFPLWCIKYHGWLENSCSSQVQTSHLHHRGTTLTPIMVPHGLLVSAESQDPRLHSECYNYQSLNNHHNQDMSSSGMLMAVIQ